MLLSRLMFTKPATVSVAVSKWELFFIAYEVKVNGQYCWDILLSRHMLDDINTSSMIFTARRYASAVLGVVILSVCPSVCLSVCLSVTRVLCD